MLNSAPKTTPEITLKQQSSEQFVLGKAFFRRSPDSRMAASLNQGKKENYLTAPMLSKRKLSMFPLPQFQAGTSFRVAKGMFTLAIPLL